MSRYRVDIASITPTLDEQIHLLQLCGRRAFRGFHVLPLEHGFPAGHERSEVGSGPLGGAQEEAQVKRWPDQRRAGK
jgi:hypothetical protein